MKTNFIKLILSIFIFHTFISVTYAQQFFVQHDEDKIYIKILSDRNYENIYGYQLRLKLENVNIEDVKIPDNDIYITLPLCGNQNYFDKDKICFDIVKNTSFLQGEEIAEIQLSKTDLENIKIIKSADNKIDTGKVELVSKEGEAIILSLETTNAENLIQSQQDIPDTDLEGYDQFLVGAIILGSLFIALIIISVIVFIVFKKKKELQKVVLFVVAVSFTLLFFVSVSYLPEATFSQASSIDCTNLDFNNDTKINLQDLSHFVKKYQANCIASNQEIKFTRCGPIDINKDKVINLSDLAYFAKQYNKNICDEYVQPLSPTQNVIPTSVPNDSINHKPRVLGINLNPSDGSTTIADEYFMPQINTLGVGTAAEMVRTVFLRSKNDFYRMSQGRLDFNIVETIDITTSPNFATLSPYTVENYSNCANHTNLTFCDQRKYEFDYIRWIRESNLCRILEEKNIDEVWMFSPPYIGRWEAFMFGPNQGFSVNGEFYLIPECKRNYIVVNGTHDRPDQFMHSYAHRIEATLNYMSREWDQSDKEKYIQRFMGNNLYSKVAMQNAYCGNAHFPHNGSADYQYANQNIATSICSDWPNFPDFKGNSQQINCSAWNCNDRDWQFYWMSFIPHSEGTFEFESGSVKFVLKKDWWYYLLNPQNVINIQKIYR